MKCGATFDKSGKYRYLLWREWDPSQPSCVFVMLNPSTADATKNDPTIRRAMSFAAQFGFGRFEAVNLFAYRATDSSTLLTVRNPIGRDNDEFILESIQRTDACFVAWGNLGTLRDRSRSVMEMIPGDTIIQCLGLNKSGEPKHPLYLSNRTRPRPYRAVPGASTGATVTCGFVEV